MKRVKEDEVVTDVWTDYQKGVMYNRTKNLYDETEQNYNFYFGKQWENANTGDEKPIVKNIVKPIIKYKLGVVNSNAYSVVFNPNAFTYANNQEVIESLCKSLNEHTNKVWELQQVDKMVREALKDSAINSEGILHSYYDNNEDEAVTEVIDKNNICYGNENDSDIQNQPYIIISYRKTVKQVIEEAKALGVDEETIELIRADNETQEQAGYDNVLDEVSPMCLVLLKYYKVDDKVYYTKSTKSVVLEKDVNTEMSLYPVCHMVWEEVKGSSRGNGEVKYIIPNQIEINRIATRRAVAVKIGAFNRLIVNKDLIDNPSSLDKVGVTIKVKGGATVDDVRKAVGYLNATDMSTDASNLQQELQADTRELAGAGDTVTGQVDPTKASGKAILAVQQASQQPLNEQLETYKTFLEDLARIWFEIWKAYKVNGLQILIETNDENGQKVQVPFVVSQDMLQELKANIKIDITPRSAYDRYAQEQSLENLMLNEKITFEEYVEALDEDSVMPKQKLEKILKTREENQEKMLEMQKQAQEKQAMLERQIIADEKQANNQEFDNMDSQANQKYNNLVNVVTGGSQNEMQEV